MAKPSFTVLCAPSNTLLLAAGKAIENRLIQLASQASEDDKRAQEAAKPFQFKLVLSQKQNPEAACVNATDPSTGLKERVIGESESARFLGRVLFPLAFTEEEMKETEESEDLRNIFHSASPPGDVQAGILQSQVDFFLNFAEFVIGKNYAEPQKGATGGVSDLCGDIADQLNKHLAFRAFLVGSGVSLADYAVLGALHRHPQWSKLRKNPDFPHIRRWSLNLARRAEVDFALLELTPELKAKQVRLSRQQRLAAARTKSDQSLGAEHYALDLPKTDRGVVTRFPPEPSGYLHIGHAKALLLNYYFKERYNGKMIVRFDDTNPSKEKQEYEESILNDIRSLGIKWDHFSHTSDFFPQLLDIATEFIKKGFAYVDDTPVEKLREWRMDGIESPGRNRSVEENLKLWKEMQEATPKGKECVLRVKMDMQHPNKCLRDPVAYRVNDTDPHHQTGTRFKVYPTYDFACPIVDSLEGVTHTLRTTEYRDRDPQFNWLLDLWDKVEGRFPGGKDDQAPHHRPHPWGYSRLNFVRTTLSKRYLNWFVQNDHVEGWNDPRFPTIRGILRRGMQVEALKEFMVGQGASKNVNTMHWDKIWATNRLYLDPIAHRYMAVYAAKDCEKAANDLCVMELIPEVKDERVEVPLHPKKPEGEKKKVLRHHRLYLEPDDAKSLEAGEEVTMMTWGNVIVQSVEKQEDGTVKKIVAKLHLEGDFKTTSKKLSWVACKQPVPITVVEFDHLLKVEKLSDVPTFEEALNPQTRYESFAWGEQALVDVKENEVIQILRRGFFRCDVPYDPKKPEQNMVLFAVPDGHVAGSMSTLSTKVELKGF